MNILNKELFWYLPFYAEFGIDREKIYLWGFKKITEVDISPTKRSLL